MRPIMNKKSKIKASITLLTKLLIGTSITLLIASCAHKRRSIPRGCHYIFQ